MCVCGGGGGAPSNSTVSLSVGNAGHLRGVERVTGATCLWQGLPIFTKPKEYIGQFAHLPLAAVIIPRHALNALPRDTGQYRLPRQTPEDKEKVGIINGSTRRNFLDTVWFYYNNYFFHWEKTFLCKADCFPTSVGYHFDQVTFRPVATGGEGGGGSAPPGKIWAPLGCAVPFAVTIGIEVYPPPWNSVSPPPLLTIPGYGAGDLTAHALVTLYSFPRFINVWRHDISLDTTYRSKHTRHQKPSTYVWLFIRARDCPRLFWADSVPLRHGSIILRGLRDPYRPNNEEAMLYCRPRLPIERCQPCSRESASEINNDFILGRSSPVTVRW